MEDEFLSADIQTSGLEARFKSLSDDLQTKVMNQALRAGAEVYQAGLTEATPVRLSPYTTGSTSLPPGALKSDVIIRKTPNAPVYAVKFGDETNRIARWVDQGHRLVRGGRSVSNKKTGTVSGKGKQIGTVEPHPFAEAAFEASESEAQQVIEQTLSAAITKAAN